MSVGSFGLIHQVRVEGDALGPVVSFVDAHQSVGQLEHVIPQRDNDVMSVLSPLLDVVDSRRCHDDVLRVYGSGNYLSQLSHYKMCEV